ncbi:hypothetical protein [Halostagnicola sp. A-GB9-2]|uniref:hypothetical protein n=1 Tax=Halostagnicola sp. A-GB9-2 TaxID=3048066 RepID=UPI0024BFF08C|nr:hypothetical protein [Halostagnicola sp. A-GB9-2]MDJ1434295.1 hypothetical protein [Halostagnicola sp. A-GB9-2]
MIGILQNYRSKIKVSLLIGIVLCALLCGVTLSSADKDPGISTTSVTETPTQYVTIEDTEYRISSLTEIKRGQSLSANVMVNDGAGFDVFLLNTDEMSEATEPGTGSSEVVFDTETLEPGSYMLGLYIDQGYVDFQPVVISGYDISVESPTTIEADEDSIMIKTTVTETELEESPDNVEVAVWNDETALREDASHVEGDTYEATISGSTFEEGESYNVYAVAQGDDEIDGEDESELLAVSEGGEFDVVAPSEEEDNGMNGGAGNGDGQDDDNDDTGEQNGENGDSNSSVDDSENGSGDETNDNGNESGDDSGDSSGTDSNSSDDTDNGDDDSQSGTIHPNESDDDAGGENDAEDSSPLLIVPVVAITALLITLVARLSESQ